MITIYGYEDNPRTRILRIIAACEDIPVTLSEVVPRRNINKVAYVKRFPLSRGKIPALETDGIKITETVAIAIYLSKVHNRNGLLGDGSSEQEAQILSLVCWANQEFLPLLATWFLPLIPGFTDPAPFDHRKITMGRRDSLVVLEDIESRLSSAKNGFLVADHITLADIFVAIYVSRGLQWVLDVAWREEHPHIMTHFNTVASWKYVQQIVPEFVLCNVARPIEDPYKINSA